MIWKPSYILKTQTFDIPISGFATRNVNILRVFKPLTLNLFDLNTDNSEINDDSYLDILKASKHQAETLASNMMRCFSNANCSNEICSAYL